MSYYPSDPIFLTQGEPISLMNVLYRVRVARILADADNQVAAVIQRVKLKVVTSIEQRVIDAYAITYTLSANQVSILYRLRLLYTNPLEMRSLVVILGDLSILPYTIDFSTQPNGALPSPFSGATWAIASGLAVNTPTEGAEKLTDGGFEVWTSPTNLTNWTETLAGTSTVNQDSTQQRSGTYCARLDIDASNSNAFVQQVPAVVVNDWVILRGYSKSIPTGKAHNTALNNQLSENNTWTITDSYALIVHCAVIRLLGGFTVGYNKVSAASSSLYFDDFSLKKLTTADLPATLETGQANVTVKGNWAIVKGSHAGVIMNLDSVSSPNNWVVLIQNGSSGNLYLWKCVAGTISQVVASAVTYVAGAAVELRKTAATTYQMWYNGAQVGADQTISDASIISNTRHGLLSAYNGNQCSFFSAA